MPDAVPRSGVRRRVLIYFGLVGPLPGDEIADQDELKGDLRTVRGVVRWVVVGAARASCSSAFALAQREMVLRMGMQGFHVVEESRPRRLRYSRTGAAPSVCADSGTASLPSLTRVDRLTPLWDRA
ncbi:hypothetical protein [Solirubrobacter pauli]|uniref:hypothetical protein n=1 Tax=Solirubrobacter pauli TaxID=166793 RepID=UPI0011C3519D|nr:hypothetical protein [Solirubrobacter pauli]